MHAMHDLPIVLTVDWCECTTQPKGAGCRVAQRRRTMPAWAFAGLLTFPSSWPCRGKPVLIHLIMHMHATMAKRTNNFGLAHLASFTTQGAVVRQQASRRSLLPVIQSSFLCFSFNLMFNNKPTSSPVVAAVLICRKDGSSIWSVLYIWHRQSASSSCWLRWWSAACLGRRSRGRCACRRRSLRRKAALHFVGTADINSCRFGTEIDPARISINLPKYIPSAFWTY